jgi:calcineurin-like phosphoesterase family protein
MGEKVWFISDTHFRHKLLARIRGFRSTEEMDARLIEVWNSLVGEGDLVYHLGDVSIGKTAETLEILKHLRGRKFLIRGNHDDGLSRSCLAEFEWVKHAHYLRRDVEGVGDVRIYLHHYPCLTWRNSHHGAWHLHGHSNGHLNDANHGAGV